MHEMPQPQLELRVCEYRSRVGGSNALAAPVCARALHHGPSVLRSCCSDGSFVPQFGLRSHVLAAQPICTHERIIPSHAYDDESWLFPVDR